MLFNCNKIKEILEAYNKNTDKTNISDHTPIGVELRFQ